MNQAPYLLYRTTLLHALREVCMHRAWSVLTAHVRMNPVHVVVEGEPQSGKIRNDFKSYASRSWNRPGRDGPDRKRWARHGSTRWLWKDQDVRPNAPLRSRLSKAGSTFMSRTRA